MEEVVTPDHPLAAYRGRTVLVTGHTGFKGTWLSIWLRTLGANVIGYSLAPPTAPSMCERVGLELKVVSERGDVLDLDRLSKVIEHYEPSVIFHLAAQPLVRRSYHEPKETFETNVQGTVNLLEAARPQKSVQATTIVTSDKCYENDGRDRAYREDDRLGGRDPYSASKAAAELVAASYRRSFFAGERRGLSTVRAGNVIGGGDWAEDRLVPDAIRSLRSGRDIVVRSPRSIRPWQHVLDPLYGYLLLTARMLRDPEGSSGPWNFGPDRGDCTVQELVGRIIASWGAGSWAVETPEDGERPEAPTLRLDSSKAKAELGWHPRLDLGRSVDMTVEWYRADLSGSSDMWTYSEQQIRSYLAADRGSRS